MTLIIRPVDREDRSKWQPLWDGYNAFYGRSGPTALDPVITELTWARFFDPAEPVHCEVAIDGPSVVGLVHYLFHRSTTRAANVCYLQDLFTAESHRGKGVGTLLIEAAVSAARRAGSSRLYWQTKADNHVARSLYDKVAKHTGFVIYASELSPDP